LKALESILNLLKWAVIGFLVYWLYTKISGLFGGQTLTQKFLPNTNKTNIIDALEAKGYSYVDAAKIADI
jgi:ferric iron reductase protein FhuF